MTARIIHVCWREFLLLAKKRHLSDTSINELDLQEAGGLVWDSQILGKNKQTKKK